MPDQNKFVDALHTWVEISMHRSMHTFIRHTRKSDLSLSQINSLFRLYHHGSSPVNEIADHLGITMAAVSQLLAPLEEKGLILRTEDLNDRRVKLIALTEKGAETVRESMRARHAWLDDLASKILPAEQNEILSALLLLNNYADNVNSVIPHMEDRFS